MTGTASADRLEEGGESNMLPFKKDVADLIPEEKAEEVAVEASPRFSVLEEPQPRSHSWDHSRSGSIENKLNDEDEVAVDECCKGDDEEDYGGSEEGRATKRHDLDDKDALRHPPILGGNHKRRRGNGRESTSEVVTAISVEDLLRSDTRPDGIMVASARTLVSRLNELPPGVGYGSRKTVIRIGDEEAAFVLGRQGRTKAKIGRVSNCRVNLTNNLDLELVGSPEARARAELYVKLVVQQRRGPVLIDFDHTDRNDLTVVDVPANCVAFVTGQQGHVLRSIEEEWATLMFFVRHIRDLQKSETGKSETGVESRGACSSASSTRPSGESVGTLPSASHDENDYSVPPKEGEAERGPMYRGGADDGTSEKLLIFGDERGRRGAELKVMSAVEQKNPRRFSSLFSPEHVSDALDFDTDRTLIGKEDFSYALGKDGGTRRKLAKASHCILEYIGRIAFIAGNREERTRCREYLSWLIQQRTGAIHVDTTGRQDVTTIVVPKALVQAIAGPRGTTPRKLEGISQTFCFIDAEAQNSNEERLLIFSHSAKAREIARQVLYDQMDRFCTRRAMTREKAAPRSEYIYQDPTERHRHAALPSFRSEWPVQNSEDRFGGPAARRSRRPRGDRKRTAQKVSMDGPLLPPRQPDTFTSLYGRSLRNVRGDVPIGSPFLGDSNCDRGWHSNGSLPQSAVRDRSRKSAPLEYMARIDEQVMHRAGMAHHNAAMHRFLEHGADYTRAPLDVPTYGVSSASTGSFTRAPAARRGDSRYLAVEGGRRRMSPDFRRLPFNGDGYADDIYESHEYQAKRRRIPPQNKQYDEPPNNTRQTPSDFNAARTWTRPYGMPAIDIGGPISHGR